MITLVTGAAGFIGSALTLKLLERGEHVLGIDNHNDYYDTDLKDARLARHLQHENYTHLRVDISNREAMEELFAEYKPKRVVNLAAQAGVRHSIENPHAYIQSNIVGFINILEGCRHHEVEHLVYASSSSVYGANTSMPFSVHDNVDHPLSIYAASKKSNELMAHSYSHLYGMPTTGLRFFTVYGPWGRPDMAPFKFAEAMLKRERIKIFNFGNHMRDFTFIDDIVEGVLKVLYKPPIAAVEWDGKNPDPGSSFAPWRIYNIGNGDPIKLLDFIKALEQKIGIRADVEMLPLQLGDMENTFSDITELATEFSYKPNTSIIHGVDKFIDWYKCFYKF